MKIYKTRLGNLERLREQYRSSVEFCRAAGLPDVYLGHLRSGSKNCGERLARKIEARLGLEHGWLDVERVNFPGVPGVSIPIPDRGKKYPASVLKSAAELFSLLEQVGSKGRHLMNEMRKADSSGGSA